MAHDSPTTRKLLVFCKIDAYGNPTIPGLLSLAGQMKMGRGLLMAVGLLEGDMVEVGRCACTENNVTALTSCSVDILYIAKAPTG